MDHKRRDEIVTMLRQSGQASVEPAQPAQIHIRSLYLTLKVDGGTSVTGLIGQLQAALSKLPPK